MTRALIALNAPGTSRPRRSLTLRRKAARRLTEEVGMTVGLERIGGTASRAESAPARPPWGLRNDSADYDPLAAGAFDPRDSEGRNCMAQPAQPVHPANRQSPPARRRRGADLRGVT